MLNYQRVDSMWLNSHWYKHIQKKVINAIERLNCIPILGGGNNQSISILWIHFHRDSKKKVLPLTSELEFTWIYRIFTMYWPIESDHFLRLLRIFQPRFDHQGRDGHVTGWDHRKSRPGTSGSDFRWLMAATGDFFVPDGFMDVLRYFIWRILLWMIWWMIFVDDEILGDFFGRKSVFFLWMPPKWDKSLRYQGGPYFSGGISYISC